MSGWVQAANDTVRVESGFTAATRSALIESFEPAALRVRSTALSVTSLFNLTVGSTLIGAQRGVNNLEEAFGALATDGLRFVSVYLPNQPQGTLVFDLTSSATTSGFNITDVREIAGVITLRSDTGAYAAGINVVTFPRG